MNFLKTLLLTGVVFSMTFPAGAVIAKRDPRTVTQPDGTTIQIKVVGDEHNHFTTTLDGLLLSRNEEGFYTYGRLSDNGFVEATEIIYAPGVTADKAVNIKDINIQEFIEKKNKSSRRRAAAQSGMGLCTSSYPRTGHPKGLIILVQYSDVSFTLSNPADYFNDMINGSNFTQYGGTGSALQYFSEQSGGKFVPSFDVLGPVTLPNKRSYYGGNDRWGDDMHPEQMVTDAIDILDKNVDFSQYDTDKDGLIDNVYIIYAGQGEASYGSADTVWPHSWDVRGAGVTKRVDGVTVAHYACSNEWEYNRPDGVGTFIHEFSHVMGLPDLYHTTASANYTPDEYSVLDYGPYNNNGRTPPNYGAYEKNAMGWYEPIMLDDAMTVTLNPIASGEFGLIPTTKNTEFFLLENRQQTGWDKYIPGHGMLIWHIDFNQSVFDSNVVNNTQSHQYVDIVEANNNPNSSSASAMAGWPFPGTTNKTEFTSTTSPALKDWSGKTIDLPVTGIKEANGLISFDIAGGKAVFDKPVGFVTDSETGSDFFIARWNAIEGATDYLLSVYAESDGEAGEEVCGFDRSVLPTGWTASSADYYTTSGNYGSSSPSFKFSLSGQTLTSPQLPGTINSISFWGKGQSSGGLTSLKIEGRVNNNWVSITTFMPTSNKVTEFEYTDIPEGVTQVKFTFTKGQGNLAIDDIVLSYGTPDEILPDYNAVSTGGETTMRVDRLKEGVKKYYFTVVATDGVNKSKASDAVHVELSKTNGVDNVTVEIDDNVPVQYFNLQGARIDNPAPGTVVIRKQGSDVTKVLVK